LSELIQNVSRRKFIAVSSAAISAPVLMNVAGMVPEAAAAEKAAAAGKTYKFVDKKSCDLVVLGGGGSGLVAAVRAAQLSGKKVIVLEKDTTAGGGAQGARTVRTFGSKWQAKHNLPNPIVDYTRAMMDQVLWELDPLTVHNALTGTGQFFDWVCELKEGIEDKFEADKYKQAELPCEPVGPQKAGFGNFMVTIMKEKCKTFGVEVLTKHPVVDVEVENGKIVAAIAKSDAGYVRVACKACVMSMGAWASNKEVVKKYAPLFSAVLPYMEGTSGSGGPKSGKGGAPVGQGGAPGGSAPGGQAGQGGAPGGQAGMSGTPGGQAAMSGGPGGQEGGGPGGGQGGAPGGGGGAPAGGMGNVGHMSPNYTGDGIPMAEKVGAFVDYNSFCFRLLGPSAMTSGQVIGGMRLSPFAITVNLDGKRFCAEPVLHLGLYDGGHIQVEQPQAKTFDIFNDEGIEATFEFHKNVKAGKCEDIKFAAQYGPPVTFPDTMEAVQKDFKESAGGGASNFFTANTLEELADKIGVNKKNLLETVKKYNEACDTGSDFDVCKEKEYLMPLGKGPFYAVQEGLSTDGAFGGVRVNPEMQAYKADRKSLVEGLYVTGDFATGKHISLNGRRRQVLNDLSWAFSSGFLAGTNVAAYLKKLG
jgi:succinate dehydrogenase/fumarate reductase flavoprotein subunit